LGLLFVFGIVGELNRQWADGGEQGAPAGKFSMRRNCGELDGWRLRWDSNSALF
jgi:hypothetical protein